MLNFRYIVRLIAAFFSRFKILLFIGVGAGIAIFFILKWIMPAISSGSTTKIGMTGRYTINTLPLTVLNMVGDGLTKIDENGNTLPNLATSWETTDKGKTWIFTLKDGVYWQDGKKVTSQTINYQFSDVTIEKTNDKTIVFKLQNAYSAFPSVVSRPTFKSGLLGTGSWKVTKLSLNGTVVEQLNIASKNDDKIIYKFYPTEDSTKLAFKLGKVDKIVDILNPSPFDNWKKAVINKSVNLGEDVVLFFNTQEGILKEKNIRQALSYAINKDAFAGDRALSPISINSWAYNPQVKPYDYDPVKAKQMIKEYKETSKLDKLSLTLTTPPLLLNEAELIAKDWREAGLEVNIQAISNIPTDYQAFLAIFDIPDDPDQYSMWHSTQKSSNITHYENARIDKLLEDGRSEIGTEDRKKIYLDFQRFLVEDSPAVFLFYPQTYTISRR